MPVKAFNRLLKWPVDQPLLAKHKSLIVVETFTHPFLLKVNFDRQSLLVI